MRRRTAGIELEKQLDEAIELAHFTKPLTNARQIAEDVYNSNPELMEKLKYPWLTDRIVRRIEKKRERVWNAAPRNQAQGVLPGFENLPRRIFLRDGRRKLFDKVTATDVREHIKMLRVRFMNHPRIKQMEAVFELMSKYSSKNPGITWEKVRMRELGQE